MIINGIEFTIGADPELWVAKGGKITSAHGMIDGDKANPKKVDCGAVQVDGTALEFNIDPATNLEEFQGNINSVLSTLRSMIPQEYSFDFSSANEYTEEDYENIPPYALNLGCSPDYNAYTGRVNPRPNVKSRLRTASGHIHIGWAEEPVDPLDKGHMEACIALTKVLDVFVGIPLSLLDIELENGDKRRRTMYGRAGDFRPKPYGMEYRVPSPRWVEHKEAQKFVFNNVLESIRQCFSMDNRGYYSFYEKDINKSINNLDARLLRELAYKLNTGEVTLDKSSDAIKSFKAQHNYVDVNNKFIRDYHRFNFKLEWPI